MGLKYNLWAYDKKTDAGVYEEYSKDFGEDHKVMDDIGIPIHDNINNGGFDVERQWVPILQPLFEHNLGNKDEWIQISFDYRDEW